MDAVRSMLFTPGHRPDLIAKAVRSAADAVIVDLEDAVATNAKEEARANLASLPESPIPYFVRTNDFETGLMWEDLVAAAHAGVDGVILPKAERQEVMLEVSGALSALETATGQPAGSITVIPMIESAVAVENSFEILDGLPRVQAVMFGSAEQGDLVADLGVEWDPTGTGLNYSRSRVLLAARAAGIANPIDGVFMNYRDSEALRTEARMGRRMGYVAKLAIHPRPGERHQRSLHPHSRGGGSPPRHPGPVREGRSGGNGFDRRRRPDDRLRSGAKPPGQCWPGRVPCDVARALASANTTNEPQVRASRHWMSSLCLAQLRILRVGGDQAAPGHDRGGGDQLIRRVRMETMADLQRPRQAGDLPSYGNLVDTSVEKTPQPYLRGHSQIDVLVPMEAGDLQH